MVFFILNGQNKTHYPPFLQFCWIMSIWIQKIKVSNAWVEPIDRLWKKITIENYLDSHYVHRNSWLRAAVLGANDGIISISSLAIGVAAASSTREPLILATVAGLVAGALSMVAGEYVSVSSERDTEKADI